MVDEVLKVIERWQSDERLASFDEPRIKPAVIEPILRGLGWDTMDPDEVWPEYRVENNRVDYALLIDNKLKIFVEAKRGSESLKGHQKQLLDYSFKEGVKIAVLTNGTTWWFYLPLQEGSWEQRKFEIVELYKQDKSEITQTLVDLLGKENVISGKAVQNAEDLRKKHQISKTFPEAWNQLVSEPDSFIVELLVEKTRELCGRAPDKNSVKQFLSEHIHQIKITSSAVAPPTPDPPTESEPSNSVTTTRPRSLTSDPDLTHMKPTSFTFNGNPHRVESWSTMLVRLCELVREVHQSQFDEVLGLGGPQGEIWFTRNKGDLDNKGPHLIQRTNIYVRTHGGGNKIVERAEKLIAHFEDNFNNFGYSAVREGEPPIRVRMQ